MMNKFLNIADKLEWPELVQIERFITLLPMSLCQFLIAHPTPELKAVC